MEFHHIGIATADAGATADRFETILDTPQRHAEAFEGIEIRFLACADGYLELLEPLDGGAIADFLDRRGPGIHHVAFETADIEGRLQQAADAGVALIDETPRAGAWDHEIAFLHPDDTGGMLIEYVSSRTDG